MDKAKNNDSFLPMSQNTNQFLADIMDLVILQDSLLVMLDVASLYTNISHSDVIKSVIQACEISAQNSSIDGKTLGTLLKLILEMNNFEFNSTHYVQINGT